MDHHLVQHIRNPELTSDNTLHVLVVISNPVRYQSRYRLARECIAALEKTPHVKVYVVESAFGDRAFEVTESGNPRHLQLRTKHELWHKENMQTEGVVRLFPDDWKYGCTADGDVFWSDPNWAQEALHQLQHYHVIQPWKDCCDLGPNGDILLDKNHRPIVHTSFTYVKNLGIPMQCHPSQPYKYGHSGFAWAFTRYFWKNIRSWMDWCIVGSADHHQAWAMQNRVKDSVHGHMPEGYKRRAFEWQAKAYRVTQGQMGFVRAKIDHKWHGPKHMRYYRERWEIFVKHNFNPDTDLAYDDQGMLCLVGKPDLAEEIRRYMRARNEDSIDEY